MREHSEYLGRRKLLPLRPQTTPTWEDRLFAALWRYIPKPKAREAHKNAWILETTWRLVDKIVSARRYPAKDQTLIRMLGRAIAAILKGGWRRQAEEAGKEVERMLGSDPPLHWEAWHWMKGWYQALFNCAPLPTWVTLDLITAERVDLYSYIPPPGENIPISVEPFPVEDSVPTEYEIKWAVKRLRNQRSRGPSGIRAEHIKGCLAETRNK